MKLWLMHRRDDDQGGYDTFDSCVVAAETEENARLTHPYGLDYIWTGKNWRTSAHPNGWFDHTWTAPGKLIVREIATSTSEPAGAVCASFNAG